MRYSRLVHCYWQKQSFFKIGLPKNCTNFTGRHLSWSVFLIKFHLKFAKFLRTHFFKEHLRWLLLYWQRSNLSRWLHYYLNLVNTGSQSSICLFKVNNRRTRRMQEICSKITIKTLEHTSYIVLLLLWTCKCRLDYKQDAKNQIFPV